MSDDRRERARACLRRHLPGLVGVELRDLGQGLEHAAFLAGDVVLRVGTGPEVVREADLLRTLAPRLPLPVPVPLVVDEEQGVLVHRLMSGQPMLGRPAVPGSARVLGEFLHHLHAVDLADVTGLVPVEDADPHEWLVDLAGPAELLAMLRDSVPPATDRRVLAHADLGAEHLLERDGALVGVLDWSDAAVTDPALDLARPYRDFGPAFLAELLHAYGHEPPDAARVRFFARCAALEDLEYGRRSGQQAYATAAQRSLTWLFGPDA